MSEVLDVDVLDADVDVLELAGDGDGSGSDFPVVGILPAKIDVDSAQISTNAIANLFMFCLLHWTLKTMPRFLHRNPREQNV
ncbi:MAG TPA: hypothetical protein VF435_08305 [Pyrinomonadaceae bacterium]